MFYLLIEKMIGKKQTFSRVDVVEIIVDVLETYETESVNIGFEGWLNDQGLNGNNGANQHLYPDYIGDVVDSFLD